MNLVPCQEGVKGTKRTLLSETTGKKKTVKNIQNNSTQDVRYHHLHRNGGSQVGSSSPS